MEAANRLASDPAVEKRAPCPGSSRCQFGWDLVRPGLSWCRRIWGDYLGDPPLAMAFLDRIVDGAIILKIKGKSYRAHRAQQPDRKATK